jgi:aconitate hydratase
MLEQDAVRGFYQAYPNRVAQVRQRLGRPLTLAEKILYAHLNDADGQSIERGSSFLLLRPDRVAMQDATAQMAILQFVSSGRTRVAVPTTVHCDHLIVGRAGAKEDLGVALRENKEVYEFLANAAKKYGMGFWKPGSGIIHQVVLENYAFPGGLMIGTDSHTPNAGGMGMFASGVGGADAVDVMVGMPWELLCPKLVGVRLTGRLNGWTSGKDIILKMLETLTCAGGTNKVIEYFGPGVASISLTGRGTVTNMGAELGATTSLFPCDERTLGYLRATRRAGVADEAELVLNDLQSDPEVASWPEKFYDEYLEIDLDRLEPMLVGPHSPDLAHPVSRMKADAARENYPDEIKVGLIGSCTNSSYEDIGRAAHLARQAVAKGLACRTPLLVTPGSDQVYSTLERDGLLEDLKKVGASILANACGPCIGQWKRDGVPPEDEKNNRANVIVTSFNRNFRGRNDGFKSTLAFIGSPEMVVALALSGKLSFNPLTDTIPGARGEPVKLDPPQSDDLPPNGFVFNDHGFQAPARDSGQVRLDVAPSSERLQLLEPFPKWDGWNLTGARVLMKAKGKCTTDHISPAGKWLRYRGHLDRISDNMFLGAVNEFTGETGMGTNLRTGAKGQTYAAIARDYRAHGIAWIAIGDSNYGEGSSREHAALEPRHLGSHAVIVRSFARIHETNLKKQGLLALTFADPADYEKVREDDRVDIDGLTSFAPGIRLTLRLHHADGHVEECSLAHSYNAEQIEWFKAGSALNIIRAQVKKSVAPKPPVRKAPVAIRQKPAARSKAMKNAAKKEKKKARPSVRKRSARRPSTGGKTVKPTARKKPVKAAKKKRIRKAVKRKR